MDEVDFYLDYLVEEMIDILDEFYDKPFAESFREQFLADIPEKYRQEVRTKFFSHAGLPTRADRQRMIELLDVPHQRRLGYD